MMLGGLSDGCGEPSGSTTAFPRLLCGLLRRKQWRDHSGNYLQALLVQDQERRNAENLSESISARAMQRFLTEARWSDETVIERLQEYLAPRLGHPEAVWVFDGSDFPSRAGNRREWPGSTAAGWARWPTARVGWAYVPAGPGVGGQAAVSAQELDLRPGPVNRRNYRWELALEIWIEPQGRVGCRRRRLRDVADLPGGTGGPGDALVLDVPGGTTVWPLDPAWTSPRGSAAPANPSCGLGSGVWSSAVMNCRMRLGGRSVAQGSQGPRTYWFSAQRVRAKSGEELWAVWRRNLDATTCPTLPRAQPWRHVGGSRWRIETEFDEPNTRPAAGQGGITT